MGSRISSSNGVILMTLSDLAKYVMTQKMGRNCGCSGVWWLSPSQAPYPANSYAYRCA